ncbi:MAG: AraC family transcriptional regulator, partial [Rhodothermales bacterium]|nr:AraC family transcriptional regulator [Rhodothermales bacterium]
AYRLAVFSRDSAFVFDWVDRIDLPVIQPMVTLLIGVSLVVYLLLSIRLLARYREWLDGEFSDVQRISLPWLRSFVIAMGIAVLTSWVFGLLEILGTDFDAWQAWWPFATNTAALYYLSVAGLAHAQSPRVAFAPETREASPSPDSGYESGPWEEQLLNLMKAERLYLRPDLVLDEVASELDAPKTMVSQVINEGFGMNFRGFVNAFRVESVRHALAGDSPLTLIGIAMDHGFNSKATFNRVFKQLAGMTPREYSNLSAEELARQPSLLPQRRSTRYSNENNSTVKISA